MIWGYPQINGNPGRVSRLVDFGSEPGAAASGPPHASGLCPCALGAATPAWTPLNQWSNRATSGFPQLKKDFQYFSMWKVPTDDRDVCKLHLYHLWNLIGTLSFSLLFQPFDPGENPRHLQYILLVQLFRHHGDHHDCLVGCCKAQR